MLVLSITLEMHYDDILCNSIAFLEFLIKEWNRLEVLVVNAVHHDNPNRNTIDMDIAVKERVDIPPKTDPISFNRCVG